ncbi:protein phosphatase 2C 57 isoform X1 [Cucumis melo var. makuwa]|uniref:protein-serine/threonine phosphatase n=1 Tax=Cucumis melo var. makuwa TaxID=1194695 RepID=A0A5A7U3R1_CUCMM|nr:protein phosphatase 2C 57 isoform X1 [Cucumis melo var. makuwa]
MALLSPRLHRFRLTKLHHVSASKPTKTTKLTLRKKARCCSAIAIDAPSSLTGAAGIRWGSTTLQGLREEMEDDAVVWSDGFNDFLFAAVFDGHGGYSSVKFLREELYKDCVAALQGGLLLNGGDFEVIKAALEKAFDDTDKRLLLLLEAAGEEDESGATATVAFIRNDVLFISHLGDSCVVLSRSGGAQVLTSSHRPYGNNSTSLQEIRRIREAGGWIVNGRICGDISVSRAFGDIRFKTKKSEMLQKGVEEGRWSEKFISRVQFNGDLVTASPEIFQVTLGSNAEFVLMASDGLWDYMNSSDAVGFVRNELRQHGDVQVTYCFCIMQDKGSQDNISIIMADLGRTDWQNLPLQQDNVIFELAQAFATIGLVSLGIWWASSSFSL